MKKLFVAAAAVAALSAGGAAMAQTGAAECGNACSQSYQAPVYPYGAIPAAKYYGQLGGMYVAPQFAPQYGQAWNYAYNQPYSQSYHQRYTRQHRHVRRDRDGDGVPNAHDRHPYDPTRR